MSVTGRALEEAREMLLDDAARRLAAGGHREADRAVVGLDLDDERAEHVDAEALAALAVLGVLRHRRGDMVVDPVAGALVVIVGAAAADHRRAHVPDPRHTHSGALLGCPAGTP